MSVHTRRALARAAVVVATLVAAASLSVVPQAVAVTSRAPLNDTRPVGSAPVRVDFPIEYFGLVADLPSRQAHLEDHGRAPFGQARFLVRGQWTAWRTLDQDGAQQPGHFTGSLVSVDRADAYQVRGLPAGARSWRAAAINTTDGPTVVVGQRRSDTATGASNCRSRADWGADESISGWSKGDQQTYYPAQALTVHHTAGSNNLTQNYAATVRAIYSYHVQTNGWSDIGYLYLVDGNGIVYEGRNSGHRSTSCLYNGGDGSDFAHQSSTDHIVTGAHVGSYNQGNVGVALMGCYESGACAGTTQPSSAAVYALEGVLASLSSRHYLNPQGSVRYVNPSTGSVKDVATISGHRDWGSTACPGGNLYARLPTIRANVASRMTPGDPPAFVDFARGSQTVDEAAGTLHLTVTRTGNTDSTASTRYRRTSGTATPDSDFTLAPGTLTFAPGEVTKTIPVSIANDAAREARETIVVSLRAPGPGTLLGSRVSTTVVIAASDQRPDGWVSTAVGSGYVGNNIYNTTGRQQTRTLLAPRTQGRTFYVRVYNDGNAKNTFAIRGSAARAGSTVRYYSGSNEVTAAMRSASGLRVALKPGAQRLVVVRLKILRSAAVGTRKPVSVSGTWTGDVTRVDLVRAVVRVSS